VRNVDHWKATKVVRNSHGFRPSSDPAFLGIHSRLVASCQLEHYQQAIQRFASGDLLDLGCGYVPFYEVYKDRVASVTCVDWVNSFHKNDFLDYSMDLNEPLLLPAESFDTVLLTDVLEHIFRPLQLLREIPRLLRSKGRCIIGVPFFYWLHEQPYDFHRYTEFALRRMCEDVGLKIESLTAYGGAPEIIADIIGKCLSSAKLARTARLHAASCGAMLKLRPIRELSKKSATLFPLGYVLVAEKSSN
jgi:SAM-dependent methyltransferase